MKLTRLFLSQDLTIVQSVSRLVFRINILLITVTSLTLRILVPPNPVYNSVHDDQLMVKMANGILKSGWIGDYSEVGHLLTSKPPGYAMFLAYTHFLPWAPTVTIHSLLLVGFLVFLREVRGFGATRGLATFVYVMLAFFPVWFNEPMSRIYREGLLTALASVTLGAGLWLARVISDGITTQKDDRQIYMKVVLTSSLVGMSVGIFIITKPSWHFLVVFILSLFAATVFANWTTHQLRQTMKILSMSIITIFATLLIPISFVLYKNHQVFGFYGLDNFSQGSYSEAMKNLYSIKDKLNRPYIDVTKQMRHEAYKVSPTMAKLRPFLELPDGQGWRYQPCVTPLKVCDESGAWFPWEFRDAVENAGLGDSAVEFNSTFSKIATEIERGCQTKKIECESRGLAVGLDSFDSLSTRVVVDSFALGTQSLLDPLLGFQQRGEAIGLSVDTIKLWESTVRNLPPRSFATDYRSGTTFLSDTRLTIGKLYNSFWTLIILVGISGNLLLVGRKSQKINQNQIIGLGLLCSIAISLMQISVLEASNGFFMTSGANLYLVPVFPFLLASVIFGLVKWFTLIDKRR